MSKLAIFNKALAAANQRGQLSSVTDPGPFAEVCNTWYDQVRRTVHEAARWESCQVQSQLTLLSTREGTYAAPTLGMFQYEYALPNDYLRAWYLTTYARFTLGYSRERGVPTLYTNIPDAVLTYAFDNIEPIHWTNAQTNAVIYGLAAAISGQISGKGSIIEKNYQLANLALEEGRAISAENQQDTAHYLPPTIRARTSGMTFNTSRERTQFIYPLGGLFGGPDAGLH